MAPAVAHSPIDPSKPAKYPIILSDELLGKPSTAQYTAVKYNHRPALSSDYAPAQASLKASNAHPGTYNLTFSDDGERYAYNGVRETEGKQYALVFDPVRKAFVLHRIESTFNMNIIRMSSNSNAESLRDEYPHIEVQRSEERTTAKATGLSAPNKDRSKRPKKEQASPATPLTFPTASTPRAEPKAATKPTSKARRSTPDSSEDEDDDNDDGGLLVEYPGGEPPSSAHRGADFSPAFSPQPPPKIEVTRRYSEFQRNNHEDILQYEDEDADADAEFEDLPADDEEDRIAAFKLPSPLGRPDGTAQQPASVVDEDADADGDADMDDIEADFEAEMENAFQEVKGGAGEESDVSEED